ncbi:MAG: hypothetical protein HY785_13530 [Oscillatoriophycideae cyanobacterium NC_groundwater_1537_Pr4_S-0.65um_50_18]|nr:hypothetical protein [Oscillatoriophycideae cyanobacterium NC_groundwater_1537_Pr4_S-0.65um_50_18]
MSLTQLPTTVLTPELPDRPIAAFPENPTLLEDNGRERKLFLTSLLLTSSLVTFALMNLPQVFSSSLSLPISTRQALEAMPLSLTTLSQSPQPQTLTQQNQMLTLTLKPAANSVSAANVILHISSDSETRVKAIATADSSAAVAPEFYSVFITIQPE